MSKYKLFTIIDNFCPSQYHHYHIGDVGGCMRTAGDLKSMVNTWVNIITT